MNYSRHTLGHAGLFGTTGIALGALGTHTLAAFLTERGTTHMWDTAVHYQLLHAIALLGAATWQRSAKGAAGSRMGWAVRCWSAGIWLFSGSLYGLAAGGPRWLGSFTPLGGIALMAGWACVVAAAFSKEE